MQQSWLQIFTIKSTTKNEHMKHPSLGLSHNILWSHENLNYICQELQQVPKYIWNIP